jgi:hypothetical protein
VRPRRDPPELHVVITFESMTPVIRVHASSHEDEMRLRAFLSRRPGVLLRVGDLVFLLLRDLLAIEDEEGAA